MQSALFDVGFRGVLTEGTQRVPDLRDVDLAVAARIEQLERLLEFCGQESERQRTKAGGWWAGGRWAGGRNGLPSTEVSFSFAGGSYMNMARAKRAAHCRKDRTWLRLKHAPYKETRALVTPPFSVNTLIDVSHSAAPAPALRPRE